MENNPTIWSEIVKNRVIQSEEFNMKESRRCNVSILINHHQEEEQMLGNIVKSSKDA